MLFKSITLLTAATAALAGDSYSLKASIGPGATGLHALQIHGNTIVYGLTQGYSYFKAEDAGDSNVHITAEGFPKLGLEVAKDGELTINANPNPVGGWAFKGDDSVKDFEYKGSREFYSCTNPTDPLHPQLVYAKTGDDYGCSDPIKFTIAASKD
ncbi:hypothetical protein CJU89_0796 [Yarrowia sp. B02]|nr:hypothetical protein CJU89_0796 [Yarrowia sp. B02]